MDITHESVAPEAQRAVRIVEGDGAVRESIAMGLRQRGLRVLTHASMSEFLREPNLDSCACLVIDDQNAELSGVELLEVLRSRHITTPAVLIAVASDPQLAHRAAQAGATVLHKPVSSSELLDALRAAVPATRLTRGQNDGYTT